MNWINNKVLINCLANSQANAKEIVDIANGAVLVGILTKNFASTKKAIIEIKAYQDLIGDYVSVGLGAGDPSMWKRVAQVSKEVKPIHINQMFSATGFTHALAYRPEGIINSLISPANKVGFVKISTGEFSRNYEAAIIPVETAIVIAKEQGANSIKYFNMNGLKHLEEFKVLAKACAKHQMILEPTGGLTLENVAQVIEIALAAGVKKLIPHVYSSIIDQATGNTNIEKLKKLLELTQKVSAKY